VFLEQPDMNLTKKFIYLFIYLFIDVQVTCIVLNSYKNQLDAIISQMYFWNKTQHVSDSSYVLHQEFFTVYTAMVYVIQVC